MPKKGETTINAILRNDLCAFIEKCFYTLEPAESFLFNWHIAEIAKKLEEIEQGKTKRLVINMPPRYLKSICISVGWVAWLMGQMPSRKIIVASHTSSISTKHSIDTRKIMQSEWYREVFPDVGFAPDQNEKHKFMTLDNGFRMATSVNSSITGEGADIIIVDDPLTPEQAYCSHMRASTARWFDQTLSTRLNNKKSGAIIVVGQRLHSDDLSGLLLKRGTWENLCLPAINDNGELLHEQREGWDEINTIRADLGEYGFAAQYLQRPLKQEGGMVKPHWLKYYDVLPEGVVYQSWDTAIKTGENNDYSVCITFVETENGYYVADVFKDKLEYPSLKRKIVELYDKWKPDAVLMEDKASGQSLLQDLKSETKIPMLPIMPKLEKLQRFASVTPIMESGRLFLKKHTAWVALAEAEICAFPDSPNDDLVDSLSQFLNWVKQRSITKIGMRRI